MIKSTEELIKSLSEQLGTSDESIALMEDVTDTLNNYDSITKDSTDWKKKYEDNDNEWRTKYKERFTADTPDVQSPPDAKSEPEKTYKTYDDLFKKG